MTTGLAAAPPAAADPVRSWQSYVLGPTSAEVTPASVLLDFGKDIAGTPSLDVTKVSGPATLNLVTGEARQFLRRPAATTTAAAAAADARQVTLTAATGLEVGNTITIGTQTRTITGFTGAVVDLDRALDAAVPAGTAVTTSPGAPTSDEARGLSGTGGPDNLQVSAPGRVVGGFDGGFRFILLTLTTPGTVTLSGVSVDFQAYRATARD